MNETWEGEEGQMVGNDTVRGNGLTEILPICRVSKASTPLEWYVIGHHSKIYFDSIIFLQNVRTNFIRVKCN